MIKSRVTQMAALAIASAMAIGSICSASAAPALSNTVAVKSAQQNPVIDVRWRHGAAAVGLGIAAGALIAGAAVAGADAYYVPDYGYAPGYAYGPGYVYAAPGYYAPGYYAPSYYVPGYYSPGYRYRQCYTDDGYGRFNPCDRQ